MWELYSDITTKKYMTDNKETIKGEQTTPVVAELNKTATYTVAEAIVLIKKLAKTKFDSSVEAHFKLGIDPKKGDQQIRAAVSLPHGTGKTIKIAAFVTPGREAEAKAAGADYVGGEDLIALIQKTEKTDFQIAVAEPAIMRDLSKIAKILGTRGLMPSPKNDTVTPNPAKAIAELKKGKISFKNDDTSNVHVLIGKTSFSDQQLIENYETIVAAIKKAKPASSKGTYIKNVSLCSTMGPGIKVA
jgi:large subunit ribosomal protein L1